ncbi:MAG: peptidoglycan DD-metalloendopeptidase family protein [Dorea sp.]|jgi:murein DD-endopeptidase MepM/ murein hydrolase activator NlpD|nr:peptidoglycan DD-metalloendopeptidase family protein [Dorea sp.]
MILRRKAVSLLLILVLCLGTAVRADASEISETEKEAEELEQKKQAAEEEKNALEEQLNAIVSEMEETKAKIDEKENQISAKEDELIQARVDENDQYESMKKRIKYMYENGNTQFIEILCESKSIGEFLNNAEYITTISEYDRDMLVEFQRIVKDVEEQEAALKREYEELEVMQNDLIAKQSELNDLMEDKEEEIHQISDDIGATQEKLKKLKEAAAEAKRKQEEAAAAAAAARKAASSGGGSAGAPVVSGNGTFTHPCPGYTYISSEFGWRAQPIPGASTNHKGMDFAAGTGTPIYAAASGTVTSASYSGNAGNLIVINHGNGLQTYYMHCNSMYVSAGQTVSKGQNIGSVGSTGNSSGPHLHFQVMLNGTPTNPRNYL